MKMRKGFVSNSSSTAFLITNLTNEEKTLVDFVRETLHLIKEYVKNYESWREGYEGPPSYTFTQEELLKSAEENNITFAPHEEKVCTFGDEDRTLIGQVYDYILRGKSLNTSDLIMERFIEAIDGKAEKPSEEVLEAFWEAIEKEGGLKYKDKFTGRDSLSFEVRFYEWRR